MEVYISKEIEVRDDCHGRCSDRCSGIDSDTFDFCYIFRKAVRNRGFFSVRCQECMDASDLELIDE